MMEIEAKRFNFLSILTGIVVLLYVSAATIGLVLGEVTWQDFTGAVGPVAGLLLGYWVRGQNG